LAYTVDDAIAAVASAQAAQPADKVAYIQASVSITDATPGTITGKGPLYRTALLGNLGSVFDSGYKFSMQRGGTGPLFLLGLDIEPIYTIGPIVVRRFPAFLVSFLQRLGLLRKRYQGDFALYLQPHFGVVLTENQDPRLTGTITPSALTPGPIVPPGTIEVVLESVAIADLFQ
jgi:hypothetical protein